MAFERPETPNDPKKDIPPHRKERVGKKLSKTPGTVWTPEEVKEERKRREADPNWHTEQP